jgi:hypothetical protein
MLSGPGAFPMVRCFMQQSYTSMKNWLLMCVWELPIFSMISPWCECHGYLRTAHRHVLGGPWYRRIGGLVFEMIFCWEWYISLAISSGLVMI